MTMWTSKEVRVLREMYPTATNEEIMIALPAHSRSAIESMVARLQIRRRAPLRDWQSICRNHVMLTGLFRVTT